MRSGGKRKGDFPPMQHVRSMSAPSKKQSHRSVAKFPTGGSFEHFVEEFLVNNRPCLFDESLTRQWPSRQLWVDDQGRPNLDYLNKKYGTYYDIV